jgi:hypothetical protein
MTRASIETGGGRKARRFALQDAAHSQIPADALGDATPVRL